MHKTRENKPNRLVQKKIKDYPENLEAKNITVITAKK